MSDLFDRQPTYPDAPGWKRGSDTSRAAAKAIEPVVTAQEQAIIEVLAARASIYTEIMSATKLGAPSVSARMRGLAHKGMVITSDVRRNTPSGRQAKVYFLTEKGRQASKRSA